MKTQIILLALIGFFTVLTANADNVGYGDDRIVNVPDAVCVLKFKDRLLGSKKMFCSGTIVNLPGLETPALISASHCFEDFKGKVSVTVQCGCTADSCAETFNLTSVNLHDDSNKGEDYAVAMLNHPPKVVKPLNIDNFLNYIDANTNKLKSDAECIMGGYGRDNTNNPSKVANLFPACNLELLDAKKGGWVRETSAIIPDALDLKIRTLYQQYAIGVYAEYLTRNFFEKLTKSQPRLYDAESFASAIAIKSNLASHSTLLPGDSGSGLLCKNRDGNYSVVGIASNISYARETKDKVTTGRLSTHFSPLLANWFK